jgi:hypothetical protein
MKEIAAPMSASGDENNQNDNSDDSDDQDWPQTVDEAVNRLVGALSEQDKQRIRELPKDDLIQFHFGWGMGIRNAFGLWGGNAALMQSCAEVSGRAFMHPDDASMVIIEGVWQRLRLP